MPTHILGVRIDPTSQAATVATLRQWLQSSHPAPRVVFTPNPEMLVYAHRHPDFRTALNQSNLNIPDGIGLVWFSRGQITERVTGTSVVTQLVREVTDIGCVIAANGLSNKSDIRVVLPTAEVITTEERFTQPHALVLVTLGSPDQERWIADHEAKLRGCKVVMGVGASLDHLTGKQHRAPLLFQRLGLEWLWRLFLQPHRFKRILTAVVTFPYLVLTTHRS